jgi:hypothetical protein
MPSGGCWDDCWDDAAAPCLLLRLLRQSRPTLGLFQPNPDRPSQGTVERPPTEKPSRLIGPGRVSSSETEREGLEPPSPFGRSLSRRVHYHSASAPERSRPDSARCASAGAFMARIVNNDGTSQVGAPGFEPGTSASRTQRSTGLSHAPNKKTAPSWRRGSGRGGIRTHETVFAAHTLSRRAP